MTFQTALPTALPPVAPLHSQNTASAILMVAHSLQSDLAQGFQIDALRLRLEMDRAFGGSDAEGLWDWKLAYEACEAALVLFLRKFGRALLARAGSPAALLPILAKVSNLLPTHTRRSEEMERFHQFSTPLPMGLAALAAAQITARDLVLEPSAGTGLLAILAEIAGGMLDDGTIEPRLRLIRPTEASTFPAKIMDDTHWLEADRAAFIGAWSAELAEVPEFSETTLHIVAGLLLPIWKQLPQDETRVYRLQTDDGQRIIGRRVSPAWVATTLASEAPNLTAAEVHALILGGKTKVQLAKGLELYRARVTGVDRIELSGFSEAQKDRLKADDFFSEIIAWKLRLFCPTDESGVKTLDHLLARFPIQGLHARGSC